MHRDGHRNRQRRPINLSAAQGGDVISILGDVVNNPRRTQTLTSEPFPRLRLRLRLITGALGGPGLAHPTRGNVRTDVHGPGRLQFFFFLFPVGPRFQILRDPGIDEVLSLRGVHPLTDKLGNLLLTTFVLPGTECFLLLPLRGPLLLLGLASGSFRPLTAVRERIGLAETLQS